MRNDIQIGNHWEITCHDKDGNFKWHDVIDNLVPTAGLNHILDTVVHGGTQVTTWYIGLVDNAGFSAYAAGDTAASHAGWTESTAYDEATRVAWTEAAASGGETTTSSASVFTISTDSTVLDGCFLISNNTKGGSTGTILGEGAFSNGDKTCNDGDTLSVSVTMNLTSS